MTTRYAALSLALLLGAGQPALAAVSAQKVERADAGKIVVTWSDAAPVDVYVADRPDAKIADARLVSKADADGRAEVEAPGRLYVLLKDTKDGRVAEVAERVLPLAQGSNFRDLGGYPAAGGKQVRWGLIYRSGGTPMLTPADQAMVGSLKLQTMIDLRSSEERVLAPTKIEGVRYQAVGYSMMTLMGNRTSFTGDDNIHASYRAFPIMLAPQMKIVFAELLSGRGAVAYNCSAGQDRTGFATAVVLSALGVPRETILADYHLSTTYRRPQYEMPVIDKALAARDPVAGFFAGYQDDPRGRTPQPLFDSQHKALLEFALAEIDSRWGSVEGYLDKELGVKAADVAKLRAMYLE
jgi:protein-tyrosine phosphatase